MLSNRHKKDVVFKIISGGQTGADRAALDMAIALGFPHGGWIRKGRKTERGPLPPKYQFLEMPTAEYPKRTEPNVKDSDGTLIVSHGELSGGSDFTREMAEKHGKSWIHVDANKFSIEAAVEIIRAWISGNNIEVLNVAGPRASKDREIHHTTVRILKAVFQSKPEIL